MSLSMCVPKFICRYIYVCRSIILLCGSVFTVPSAMRYIGWKYKIRTGTPVTSQRPPDLITYSSGQPLLPHP